MRNLIFICYIELTIFYFFWSIICFISLLSYIDEDYLSLISLSVFLDEC